MAASKSFSPEPLQHSVGPSRAEITTHPSRCICIAAGSNSIDPPFAPLAFTATEPLPCQSAPAAAAAAHPGHPDGEGGSKQIPVTASCTFSLVIMSLLGYPPVHALRRVRSMPAPHAARSVQRRSAPWWPTAGWPATAPLRVSKDLSSLPCLLACPLAAVTHRTPSLPNSAGQKQHWKEHKPLCTPPKPKFYLFACPVGQESDLPPIKEAVFFHNKPFDPALNVPRVLRRDSEGRILEVITGQDRVRVRSAPFLRACTVRGPAEPRKALLPVASPSERTSDLTQEN